MKQSRSGDPGALCLRCTQLGPPRGPSASRDKVRRRWAEREGVAVTCWRVVGTEAGYVERWSQEEVEQRRRKMRVRSKSWRGKAARGKEEGT